MNFFIKNGKVRRLLFLGAAVFFLHTGCLGPSPEKVLATDRRLHDAAVTALNGRPGAVVVMDVKTGRIRALAGEDAAVRRAFTPGSLVKLVTVWKGLEHRTIDPDRRFTCTGRTVISGTEYSCWYPPGHGDLDLVHAIAYSCNLYFLTLASKIGANDTYDGLSELGFGKKTGINLPGETPGVLDRSPEGKSLEYAVGDTPAVTASPLQVIVYLSALVNGGNVFVPRITETEDDIENFTPRPVKKVDIAKAAPVIIKGMRDAVSYGTAMKAAVDSLSIMGKTGTGEITEAPWETHAWFLGFAPAEDPEIAVVVFIDRGRGGDDAAPIAGEIFRAWLEGGGDR